MAIKDHLEKLNYFYQVAKSGTINEAASILNITQPSITKSIKILEGAIGVPLFVRLPRGVRLTTEGDLLLKFCHTIFSQLEDLEVKLSSPDDPMAGTLKVGTYDSIAIYFWPRFLQTYLPDHPNLNLELTTGRSMEIQKKVEQGELDIGLIIEPRASTNMKVIGLSTDSFQLYSTAKEDPHKKGLMNSPLIYMPDALAGEKNERLIHSLTAHNKLGATRHHKTSSLESAKELIINGIGIGLLPKMVAQDAVKKKKIVRIQPKGFPKAGVGKHQIGVIYQKHNEESNIMQNLIQSLKAHSW